MEEAKIEALLRQGKADFANKDFVAVKADDYYLRGRANLFNSKCNDAFEDFNKAIELRLPDEKANDYYWQGVNYYYYLHNENNAFKCFEKVLKIDPNNENAKQKIEEIRRMQDVRKREEQEKKAKELFEKGKDNFERKNYNYAFECFKKVKEFTNNTNLLSQAQSFISKIYKYFKESRNLDIDGVMQPDSGGYKIPLTHYPKPREEIEHWRKPKG
jgi:tetratricopeptide (TPR) repeat protein